MSRAALDRQEKEQTLVSAAAAAAAAGYSTDGGKTTKEPCTCVMSTHPMTSSVHQQPATNQSPFSNCIEWKNEFLYKTHPTAVFIQSRSCLIYLI